MLGGVNRTGTIDRGVGGREGSEHWGGGGEGEREGGGATGGSDGVGS